MVSIDMSKWYNHNAKSFAKSKKMRNLVARTTDITTSKLGFLILKKIMLNMAKEIEKNAIEKFFAEIEYSDKPPIRKTMVPSLNIINKI